MLKKTFTYTDYDGNERTEDAYFNLSETELVRMENSTEGGLRNTLEKIVAEKDNVQIMKYFDDIIRMSYGQKSPDGRRLIKSDQLFEEFTQTEAYNQLMMELYTDADAAADFVNGLIPKNLSSRVNSDVVVQG